MELAAAVFEGLRWGAVGSAFTLGLRHGFDWDHVAAIADITSSQDDTRRSLLYSTLYILGHAVVVSVLGLLAVLAGSTIPGWLDGFMGRVVGATLLALGVWVIFSLARNGRDVRLRSRWMLAITGVRRALRWLRRHRSGAEPVVEPLVIEHEHEHPVELAHHGALEAEPLDRPLAAGAHGAVMQPAVAARAAVAPATHRHRHAHLGTLPDDPFTEYGVGTSVGVGMLHGVGAETPTQMVLFGAAAGAGTAWVGATFLLAFVVGLVIANTAIALASRFGVLNAGRNFAVYAAVTVVVAGLSLYLGTVLLLGLGEGLPTIFA